jgi:hypothetical protein
VDEAPAGGRLAALPSPKPSRETPAPQLVRTWRAEPWQNLTEATSFDATWLPRAGVRLLTVVGNLLY